MINPKLANLFHHRVGLFAQVLAVLAELEVLPEVLAIPCVGGGIQLPVRGSKHARFGPEGPAPVVGEALCHLGIRLHDFPVNRGLSGDEIQERNVAFRKAGKFRRPITHL